MLENFEVDTNIVKLRTDRFSSIKAVPTIPAKAGCISMIGGGSVVGIAVNDADPDSDEETVLIYRADKIMLPCKGQFGAGAMIGIDAESIGDPVDPCELYMSDSGFYDDKDDTVTFHAIALEDCDSESEITWVLCDLFGAPVIAAADDEGAVT